MWVDPVVVTLKASSEGAYLLASLLLTVPVIFSFGYYKLLNKDIFSELYFSVFIS